MQNKSYRDSLVALAGGGQTGATPCPASINVFSTVATHGDSALLPDAKPGREIIIQNLGAKSLTVYPQKSQTINGLAVDVGLPCPANSMTRFYSGTAGKWFGGEQQRSYVDGLTALAGGAQAGTALTAEINVVATVATIADSVQLPDAKAGTQLVVQNKAANSMNVFPQTGQTINALAANAALACAGASVTIFYCATAGAWFSK